MLQLWQLLLTDGFEISYTGLIHKWILFAARLAGGRNNQLTKWSQK